MNQFDQYCQIQTFKTSRLLLEAPRATVWPLLLDFSSFNDTFERIEVLSGTPNTVGAISRLTKRQGEWWMPPYLVKIVHIDPGKQIVWKMFPEEGEVFSAFVDFSLDEVGEQTSFVIRLYKDNRVTVRSVERLAAEKERIHQASERLEREVMFPNLKRLVEQRK
jgi:hypothetical protein